MPFHAFTHSFIDTTIGLSYINNSTSTYSKHKQFFTCCSCCPQYSLWLSDFLSLQIQFFLLPSKTCVLSGSSWSFSPLCWPPILPGPPWVPLRRLMWPAKTQKTEPPLTRIISISSRCPQFHILYTIHHHSWFSRFWSWLELLLSFQMIQNGFWVFVDMASGGYLWRNLKSRNDGVREVKSS